MDLEWQITALPGLISAHLGQIKVRLALLSLPGPLASRQHIKPPQPCHSYRGGGGRGPPWVGGQRGDTAPPAPLRLHMRGKKTWQGVTARDIQYVARGHRKKTQQETYNSKRRQKEDTGREHRRRNRGDSKRTQLEDKARGHSKITY